jgi:chaperonin GroES
MKKNGDVVAKAKKSAKKVAKKPAKKATNKPVKKAALKKVAQKPAKKPLQKKAVKTVSKATAKAIKAPPAKKIDISQFISPLDDRLIVQVVEGERRTAGGLFIPDTAVLTGNKTGLVLSVGRGHRDKKGRIRPMDVQAGDRILFAEFTGDEIEFSGQKLQILREADVMGVVN